MPAERQAARKPTPKTSSVRRAPTRTTAQASLPTQLQRRCGNSGAQAFLQTITAQPAPSPSTTAIQPKLTVGPPDDMYEREADAAAERVAAGRPVGRTSRLTPGGLGQPQQRQPELEEEPVQMQEVEAEEEPRTAVLQRQEIEEEEPVQMEREALPVQQMCENCLQEAQREGTQEPLHTQAEDEEEPTQMRGATSPVQPICENCRGRAQRQEEEEEGAVQTKPRFVRPPIDTQRAEHAIARSGSGSALSPALQRQMEAGFGAGFSGVRVHTGSSAGEAAQALNARAFTRSSDIYLARNESPSNRSLIGHELTHVVQQGAAQSVDARSLQRQEGIEEAGVAEDTGEAARRALEGTTGGGVRKPGRISREEQYLRQAPHPGAGDNVTATLEFNNSVFVEAAGGKDNLWYKIVTETGGQGWVPSASVALDPPEPTAELYKVQPGDKAINLAGRWYGPPGGWKRWWWPGSDDAGDARFYVGALAFANKGRAGMFSPADLTERDAWMKVQVIAPNTIWRPSKTFLQALRGKVSSGSITKELWEDVKRVAKAIWDFVVFAAAFISGLLYGAAESIYDLFAGVVDLAKMVWSVAKSLISGNIVKDAKQFWEDLKKIDIAAIGKDFAAKWFAEDPWDAGFFQGRVLGYVIMEIVMFVLSAGTLTVLKWAGKFAKIGSMIAKLPRVVKFAEAAKSTKAATKLRDALGKGVIAGGKALSAAQRWARDVLRIPAEILKDLTDEAIARLRTLPTWAHERLRSLTTPAKRAILGCASKCKVDITRILTTLEIPQGFSVKQWRKFRQAARRLAREAGLPKGELAVQGSRTKGVAKFGADIDIVLRVDEDAFFEFAQARISSVRPGTDLQKRLVQAARKGQLSRFFISKDFNKQLREHLVPRLPRELSELGDIDFSVIKIGSKMDTGPFISLGRW